MSSTPPQVFSNITPDQYAALVQKAAAAGVDLSGNSGTASKFGVEVAWNYSPDTQQLTIQCLNGSIFMNCDAVNAKIASLIEESIA
jgi:hypothetical protein